MALITSIRDSQIVLPDIRIPLEESTPEEGGTDENFNNMMQTKVTGIMHPLIALNGITVAMRDLLEFKLDWTKAVPEVEFAFRDREGNFSTFATPGISNELQVQIIPPFDNAYKKVNLLFYVNEILIDFGQVRGRGQYKVLDLIQGQFKSLGQMSTFELCDTISINTGLGFASNVLSTEDLRYIYMPMKSYLSILEKEIQNSASNESHVYDFWIDLWNNIVLCDMYDRYSTEDQEEDMTVWVSDVLNKANSESKLEPYQTTALFSNIPQRYNTELYLTGYTFNNAPASYTSGTSKVVSLYSEETHDYVENYIMDGDSVDEFLVEEYGGEFYGPYNYLIAKQCRDIYLRKIYGETLSIYTNIPCLGINRGDQVRVVWMDSNTTLVMKQHMYEDLGGTPQEQKDFGWLNDFVYQKDLETGIILNTNVSGQYTVIGMCCTFKRGKWLQEYILARPANRKTPMIDEIQYSNDE